LPSVAMRAQSFSPHVMWAQRSSNEIINEGLQQKQITISKL